MPVASLPYCNRSQLVVSELEVNFLYAIGTWEMMVVLFLRRVLHELKFFEATRMLAND